MKYRLDQKSGNALSVLGFGCMRFPLSMEKTEQLIVDAVEAGVNYFDTAYLYPRSEATLGTILKKNALRDRVYIADKLPGGMVKRPEDMDELLRTQLERLQTEYIDYYLMHNMSSAAEWRRLCELGARDWLAAQKASGTLRQVGFSYHGNRQEFLEILDDYDWDFVQIQYNYLDERNQAGVAGLKRAAEKGMPVIIMEPLLGGKLANNLPKGAHDAFRRADAEITPAAWGLKWLYNQPEVTVVLSGMNEPFQLEDNLKTAELAEVGCISPSQMSVFAEALKIIKATDKIPCTACGYCMPCPHGVNIPACFSSYNLTYSMGFVTGAKAYVNGVRLFTGTPNGACQCVGCRECEKHCPQGIKISENMKQVKKRMEPWYVRAIAAVVRRVI